MSSNRFRFCIGANDICSLASVGVSSHEWNDAHLPRDFADIVDDKDDQFRDTFTRLCLYLSNKHIQEESAPTEDLVILGTEFGNIATILRFLRQGRDGDRNISAQQFPHATASSASTYINLAKKIRGGNVTLNGGSLTPAIAMLHALLQLESEKSVRCHIFLGDTYCAEALADVRKSDSLCGVTPGVCYAAITSGAEFYGEISFGEVDGEETQLIEKEAGVRERNHAFAFHRLICAAKDLPVGGVVAMGFGANGRFAQMRIERRSNGD